MSPPNDRIDGHQFPPAKKNLFFQFLHEEGKPVIGFLFAELDMK